MPPLALKPVSRGDKLEVVNHLTAAKEIWTIMDVAKGLIKIKSDRGSTVTRFDTWFSPALEWDDEYEKGTSVVDWTIGSLWPLDVGNKAYFHRIVMLSDGTKREENWRCSVENLGRVNLATTTKEHDAYKVVCVSEPNIHTWYWSPKVVGPVKYIRTSVATGGVAEVIERADLGA